MKFMLIAKEHVYSKEAAEVPIVNGVVPRVGEYVFIGIHSGFVKSVSYSFSEQTVSIVTTEQPNG